MPIKPLSPLQGKLMRLILDSAAGDGEALNALSKHSLTPRQQAMALQMIDEGKSQSEIAEVFRVHRSTICRLAGERRVLEYR